MQLCLRDFIMREQLYRFYLARAQITVHVSSINYIVLSQTAHKIIITLSCFFSSNRRLRRYCMHVVTSSRVDKEGFNRRPSSLVTD